MIKFDSINNGWILYTPFLRQDPNDQFSYIQSGYIETYHETLHSISLNPVVFLDIPLG